MNTKRMLGLGYFPKELPPPFETTKFAEKASYINRKWNAILTREKVSKPGESPADARKRFRENYTEKYSNSRCSEYSLPKGVYSRRKLGIPNPKQYYDLCGAVVENWNTIKGVYKLSKFSASTPIEADAIRSVRTQSKSLNNFRFELIEKSFNKRYELCIDVSQFYPTIYTHSIPWAVMGKSDAKKYFLLKNKPNWTTLLTTDAKARVYVAADKIDTLVRNCQEKQSIGFPIGPDTSFILAEVLASRIDSEVQSKLRDVDFESLRYYDDYYFYTNSYNDAERILKAVQQVLNEFQLETNESKVRIKELPFSFEQAWESTLSSQKITPVNEYRLRSFFSVLFRLAEENLSDAGWIIEYALGRFEYGNVRIQKKEWDLFLNLLLKALLFYSGNINQVFKILLSYKMFINDKSKRRISLVLHRLIEEHLSLNHSFEVSWALWVFKSLKIKLDNITLRKVLASTDYFSKLICLDILNANLYTGQKPSLVSLTRDLRSSDLMSDKWLFTYEAIKQGWLIPTGRVIEGNEYLKILYDYDVKFYNSANQVKQEFTAGEGVQVTDAKGSPSLDKFAELFKGQTSTTQTNKENELWLAATVSKY